MKIRNIVIIWLSRIVLNLISPENKSLFRKLENFEKKKISTQLHREFNQIYIYIILYTGQSVLKRLRTGNDFTCMIKARASSRYVSLFLVSVPYGGHSAECRFGTM